jgi:Transposase C of IS166 homeodomain
MTHESLVNSDWKHVISRLGGPRPVEKAAARTQTVQSFQRKRPARKPFSAHLPRERVVNTTNRTSAIDARTTRHSGCAVSQQKRKLTEEPFGWAKTIGEGARPMLRGAARLRFKFTLAMVAYDLIRLSKVLGASP